MSKIIITGGSGMVGSLLHGDIKLGSKDVDLTNQQQVKDYFEKTKPTDVIHCAAKVGGVKGNMGHMGEYYYDNVMINTNVIHESYKNGVKNLVCFLSTCVFPDNVEYPLSPEKIYLGPPHSSNYGYAYSKRMALTQIEAYRNQYGINYKSVIPCNIYGPNDNFSLEHGHVIPMLIHKCFLAKQENKPLRIWGRGNALREFIYCEDVAKITDWVLKNYEDSEPLILSTSVEISIKELVNIIVKAFNFEGEIIYDTTKPEGQLRKPSDNSRLKELLPEFEFTPIEIGIQKTVEWFVENYNTARK